MTEAADKETTTPDEQRRPQHREHRVETGVDEIKNPTLLALRILLAVVLATVDVRQQILKKHGFVLSYLFTLGADQSQPAEVHEYVAKCLDSLFLVADPEDFRIFFPPLSQLLSHTGEDGSQTFLDAVLNLIRVDNDAVLEYTIRLLSYVYEYADAEVVTILDEYPIFDEIAKLLNAGPMNLQMFLQQFMSHLTLRIPTRLHQTFRELFLKYMDAPNLVTVVSTIDVQ